VSGTPPFWTPEPPARSLGTISEISATGTSAPSLRPSSRPGWPNGQVDTIIEAYWISLQIGTTTIRKKFHQLPHLPSDLVLGIDLLRRYPFSIDLKEGSASLRPPTTADEVQPTQAQPAFQVSDSPPLTLSPDEEQRLRQFLAEELPLFDSVRGLTPLARHEIRLLHPEPE
jgi:hypothetical protein